MESASIRVACRRTLALSLVAVGLNAGLAVANGPVGEDPVGNFVAGPMPSSCSAAPRAPACVNAAVYYLDRARANLGQPRYALPPDFVSRAPDQQILILTNLDRTHYGLPPVTGLTHALDQDARQGVQVDADPLPSDPHVRYYTANWASGNPNLLLAYESWMYDDGQGSGNQDCTPTHASGCWGHRHDVLRQFAGTGQLAMGAAAGVDRDGRRGYAMLLVSGDSRYTPAYAYSWQQAVRDGAGTNPYAPRLPSILVAGATEPIVALRITSVRVTGHTITVTVAAAAGARLLCSLTRRTRKGWAHGRFSRCRATVQYRRRRSGRYRLRVRAGSESATRVVVVR
jgi:hypothetical protein